MLQTDIFYVSYSTSIFPKDIGGIWHFWRKVVNDVRLCTLYLKTNKSSKSFNFFNQVALFDREICPNIYPSIYILN